MCALLSRKFTLSVSCSEFICQRHGGYIEEAEVRNDADGKISWSGNDGVGHFPRCPAMVRQAPRSSLAFPLENICSVVLMSMKIGFMAKPEGPSMVKLKDSEVSSVVNVLQTYFGPPISIFLFLFRFYRSWSSEFSDPNNWMNLFQWELFLQMETCRRFRGQHWFDRAEARKKSLGLILLRFVSLSSYLLMSSLFQISNRALNRTMWLKPQGHLEYSF
jgi:hypothetical protein